MQFKSCKVLSISRSWTFLTVIFMLIQASLSAQDSILFLNGQQFSGKILEDMGDYFKMELSGKEGKRPVIFAVDKDMIFKVKRSDSTNIFYTPDSSNVNDLSISEMVMYIKGEQVAIATYHPWVSPATAFLSGMTGAYLGFWGLRFHRYIWEYRQFTGQSSRIRWKVDICSLRIPIL